MVVIQSVLLYESETWVITPSIGRGLIRFQNRVSHRLMGWKYVRGREGMLVYPLLVESMEKAVLQEVDTYVSHPQKKVAQFIATSPIMELFLVAERRPGSRETKKWWEQEGLCLEGMWTVDQEAEREEVEEDTENT